jgi:hypothetical protein
VQRKYDHLGFEVKFPEKMNDRERARWLPVIRLVHTVCEQQGIPLKVLTFHHHVPARRGWQDHHEYGEADLDDKIIELCAKDHDTALHELAHIWCDTFHTEKWARAYIKLLLIYMLPHEAEYHIALNSQRYPAFNQANLRRLKRGNKLPPVTPKDMKRA